MQIGSQVAEGRWSSLDLHCGRNLNQASHLTLYSPAAMLLPSPFLERMLIGLSKGQTLDK